MTVGEALAVVTLSRVSLDKDLKKKCFACENIMLKCQSYMVYDKYWILIRMVVAIILVVYSHLCLFKIKHNRLKSLKDFN